MIHLNIKTLRIYAKELLSISYFVVVWEHEITILKFD